MKDSLCHSNSMSDNNIKSIEELGYTNNIEQLRQQQQLSDFDIGRVIAEHKERYIVKTVDGEYKAEITGNIRFTAQSRMDFPTVGDWVAVCAFDDQLIIHAVIERQNLLKRKAVGKKSDEQAIASNIDYALIVQSSVDDFSLNRLERYLIICNDCNIHPIVILSKIDQVSKDELELQITQIKERTNNTTVIPISNYNNSSIQQLLSGLQKERTYCLLGSSGVGKSTLINNIMGNEIMKTKEISIATSKGQHTTTHKQLFISDEGVIIIDTPGMRELGIGGASEGLSLTFDALTDLSKDCKYKNCTHMHEKGCAIIEALNNDLLDEELYNNYIKLYKEQQHYEMSVGEKKRKGKELARIIKDVKKNYRKK
ncbi:MAG: ribosome small subunit-dependent GTPase A [Hyphomicrobiales bacterium]